MNYSKRVSLIHDYIQRRSRQFGRPVSAADTGFDKPGRWISDDPSWKALVVPGQLPATRVDPNDKHGGDWDLLQVWVHGTLRVTAHIRGDEISVKLYKSGPWDKTFHLFGVPPLPPLLPGGHVAQF
jgi:hypothetical protein